MRNILWLIFVGIFTVLGIMGCAVYVTPVLNSSLSMDAFEKMGKIDLQDVKMALYLDPKIKELKVNTTFKSGHYTFDIGKAFSVKMIKALAYNFRTIYFIEKPEYTDTDKVDAIMYINLEDVDTNFGVKTGFSSATIETYVRLSIRAEMKDMDEKRTIWVGTTQAKESKSYQGELITYQEGGRGAAIAIDSAIDKAIGDLLNDMSKSQNLHLYIEKWKQKHKGDIHAQ